MALNLLASLHLAGVIQRSGPRRSVLRVAPRFLAHAEGTAGRLRLQGHASDDAVLEAALATWDDYHHDVRAGARFLASLLDERGQWGPLRPAFATLEPFLAGPAV